MTSNIKIAPSLVLYIIIAVQIFVQVPTYGQNEECQLVKSKSGKIYTVDTYDLICLAQTSLKEKTLIYSFDGLCKPCRYKLPSVLQLAKDYDIELFILLRDKENSRYEASAIEYLENMKDRHDVSFKTYILKDENGISDITHRKIENEVSYIKYRRFVKRITPDKFEYVPSMGKLFLIDQFGEVIMVTSYKDRVGEKWKDNTSVIDNKIKPLLNKKTIYP